VPSKFAAHPKLGKWVSTQRSNYEFYQEGYPSPMTEERIRELESLGVELKIGLKSIWSARFQELCEFKAQFGYCVVPIKYSVHPKLPRRVSTQRSNYTLYREGKPIHMTEERIRELKSVGVKWGTSAGTSITSLRYAQNEGEKPYPRY